MRYYTILVFLTIIVHGGLSKKKETAIVLAEEFARRGRIQMKMKLCKIK